MKKLLVLGLLSLTALSVMPQTSHAWFRCWRCSKYSTYICIRPYNAFSPVSYGNITSTGCCPMMLGGSPMGGCPVPAMPSCFNPCPPSCTMGFGDGGCLPSPSAFAQQPMMPGPMSQPLPQAPQQGPQFTPPQPMPLNPAAYQTGYNPYLYNYGVMQAAAYQGNYYGNYPGYGYQPNYYQNYGYGYGNSPANNVQVPSYWYGNR